MCGHFSEPNNTNYSVVAINKQLCKDEIIRTTFHELRHYYQYLHAQFRNKAIYQQFYNNPNALDSFNNLKKYEVYKNSPWEIDAREFEMDAWRSYQLEKIKGKFI